MSLFYWLKIAALNKKITLNKTVILNIERVKLINIFKQ